MDAFRAGFGIAWNGLTETERSLIRGDVRAIMDDPDDREEEECYTEEEAVVLLRRRIGGPVNLKGYAKVLASKPFAPSAPLIDERPYRDVRIDD